MPSPRVNTQNTRSHSTEETIVREHLAELRERVRLLTWVSGLSWLAVMLLGGLIVTGSLDWLFHFDESGTRLIFGLALLGGTSWIGWKCLIAPLRQQLTGTFLASRVERRYPDLNGRLVSAVEFLEHRLDQKLGSPELQQAVVGQALNDLAQVNTSDIVEARSIRNISFAGIAVLGLALLVTLVRPLESATAVQRLAFPFAKISWPRAVELQLVRPDLTPFVPKSDQSTLIARGDNLELYVQNKRGRLPERVWFEFRTTNDGPVSRELLRQTSVRDAKDQSHDAALINWIATNGILHFRAVGGDDDVMPFQRVEVVQPPIVKSLRVTVNPPPYTQRPVESLPPDVGHVTGLLGTRIDAQVESDKPLKSAMLRIGDHSPVPLELQPDDQHFTASFTVTDPVASRYWFELTDKQDFHDREPVRYELRGIADGIPEVAIETPVTDVLLTPTAELPVNVFAKDDLGLKDIHIAYQIGDDENIHTIPLFPGPKATQPASDAATTDNADDSVRQDPNQQHVEYRWKMADLQLQPGSKIVFRAEATDRCDLGPPHIGKSIPRTITIVSSDEKQKELASRVTSILDELDRVAQLQQRARQETHEVQAQLENVGELRPQDLDQLRHVELDQRQTASRLTHPADGVQTKARQLLDEFRANQLSDERTEQRMDSLASELERLEQDELPKAERALTMAQKLAETESASQQRNDNQPPDEAKKSTPNRSADQPNLSDTRKPIDQPTSSNDKSSTKPATGDAEKKSTDQKPSESSDQPNSKSSPDKPSATGESTEKADKPSQDKTQDAANKKSSSKDDANPSDSKPADTPPANDQPNEPSPAQPSPSDESPKSEPPKEKQPAKPAPTREKAIEAALAEAHQRQTRSLETLRELQQSLSEWRDRRDVSRDLESVISEQDAVQKEAAEMAARTMTKSAAELTKQDKAELSKLSAKQRKIAEQLDQFRKQLEQTASSLNKNDPETAEKLNEVDHELSQQETASRLQDAAQDIADNKMGSAAESQQKAMEELREAERMMKRQPNDDTEQFVRQTEDALQEFKEIREEQQDLLDQAQELASQPDTPQKQEQLDKLKEQQEQLAERMAKAERKLERLRLRGAAEAVNRARTRLNEMMQQAMDSDDADDMQQAMEEAVDDLEQVERELALEKRIAQERLAFEQLEKIEDELKALRSRQQTVIDETARLDAAKAGQDTLTRGQLKTLKELSETERSLQQQAEQMQRQMASAEVVSLFLRKLSRSLGLAADRLGERETAAPTQTLETDAIRKIDSLLAVLAKDQKKPEKPDEKPEELSQEQQEQEEKPEEAQPPGDTIPQLAQLKLLKTMQEEFLEHTEMLNKFRDKDGKLPESMEAEKAELAREQAELADFARNLVTKFQQQQPDPDEKPEAKPKAKPKSRPKQEDKPAKETDPSKIDL